MRATILRDARKSGVLRIRSSWWGARLRASRTMATGEWNDDSSEPEKALVRRKPWRAAFGLDFGSHHSLGAWSEPDQHELAGAQLGHPEAAQCFHVYKYIRRPLAAGQEAEAAQAVEPLDLRPLQPAGRGDADMGPRRQHLRRMDRGGLVHLEDPERLVALGALHALANQPRAFVGGLVAVAPKHGDVQKHVRPA